MEPRNPQKVLMRFSGLVFGFSSLSSTSVSLRFFVPAGSNQKRPKRCQFIISKDQRAYQVASKCDSRLRFKFKKS